MPLPQDFCYTLVVGCQRSGTTLLGQVIGAHPAALLIDEDDGATDLIVQLVTNRDTNHDRFWRCVAAAREKYNDPARFGDRPRTLPGVSHIVLKVPNATYYYVQLARLTLDLRPIFLTRDVRDVVCSMERLRSVAMVENQIKRMHRAPGIADRFAVELTLLEDPRLAPYRKRALIWRIKTSLYSEFLKPPLDGLMVRYEDLVRDPEKWITVALAHLGLSVPAPGLRHETVLGGTAVGHTRRDRAIDDTSVGNWTRDLSTQQEAEVWLTAGPLMTKLGYQRSQ